VKLVFVTQEVDPGHRVLGQTVDLVRALAARVDELAVVARDVTWDDVPANASVRTFEAGGKLTRGLRFEQALASSVRGADGVLVHMVPEFAVLAAPLTRLRRLPLALWYTHWHASRTLELAARLVDVALSVDASSFPLQSAKVRGIGHAIDVERFAASAPTVRDGPLRVLALGRTARWKGLATLLDALALAVEDGTDAALEIRGPSLTDDERVHRAELVKKIAADARLTDRVNLRDPVPRAEIPALLASVDIVASPSEPRTGSTLDKAVYEAAACARPIVSTNASFAPLLGGLPLQLIAPPRDPAALAAILGAVAAAAPSVRMATGDELRRRVVEHHSLDHWAEMVIATIGDVRSRRGKAGTARAAG
jgi:glycosyltransferase involved in cell wall biosynthesis